MGSFEQHSGEDQDEDEKFALDQKARERRKLLGAMAAGAAIAAVGVTGLPKILQNALNKPPAPDHFEGKEFRSGEGVVFDREVISEPAREQFDFESRSKRTIPAQVHYILYMKVGSRDGVARVSKEEYNKHQVSSRVRVEYVDHGADKFLDIRLKTDTK